MTFRFTSRLLATALAIILALPGFAQEPRPSKDPPPQDSNTQQSSVPQTASPPSPSGNAAQNAAPAQNPPGQAEPKPGETPSDQNAPATQQQSPPQQGVQPPEQPPAEVKTPAAPKPTSRKTTQKKKRKATTSAPSKSAHRPKEPAAASTGEPGKIVIRNGGAKDDVIHLSPGGTQEQEAHNRENTTQLLATTDQNLKSLSGRQLSSAEQNTVDQIHSYMRQAKSAADSGDLARAHTLAFKAHLLSDDLAKR